jgi:hypothetical protein
VNGYRDNEDNDRKSEYLYLYGDRNTTSNGKKYICHTIPVGLGPV